jgi:hypothetical protein
LGRIPLLNKIKTTPPITKNAPKTRRARDCCPGPVAARAGKVAGREFEAGLVTGGFETTGVHFAYNTKSEEGEILSPG